MKVVTFILFFVVLRINRGVTPSNLFDARKIYTYDVTSTWLHSNSLQNSSETDEWNVKYQLYVTAIEPNKIVLQTGMYHVFRGNNIPKEIQILSCIQNELETPVEVTLDTRGQPILMKFQYHLHEWSMNIKKLEVIRFILNTEASPVQYDNVGNDEQVEYVVQEKSIMGQCEAKYIVQQKELISTQSNNLIQNVTRAQSENEFVKGQIEHYASKSQRHAVKTSNVQHVWSCNMAEDFHHVGNTQRFCDNNSNLYEFRKTTDIQNCLITENFGSTRIKVGMIKTQYITCGINRKNTTMLQISSQITTEDEAVVDKISLVDISDIEKNEIPNFPDNTIQITNFDVNSFERWYDFQTFVCSDVERSNLAKLHRTQGGDDINKFRACIQGNVAHPSKLVLRYLNSGHYNHLNLQWNLRKEKVYPLAYFLPTTSHDVAAAVRCGLDTDIHLVPNSGGHSYEGIGWGNNNTVVVDFRNMKKISVHGSGPHAIGRVQPGALVSQINAYFWENGGYAFPMGGCTTVAIGGHAIGGGIGYFSTQYGMAIDNVLEYEMVDGRGQIVIANHKSNSDLFWALRGVGPGYIGIVTNFKVKLFEAYKIKITRVTFNYRIKHFARVYIAYQNMIKWVEVNEPTTYLLLQTTSDKYNSSYPPALPGISVYTLHIQDSKVQPKGNVSFLKTFYKIFPKPDKITQDYPNYIQVMASSSYAAVINPQATSTELMNLTSDAIHIAFLKSMRKEDAFPRYFKEKSFYIKKYFTLPQMKRVAHILHKAPNYIWMFWERVQGVISQVGKNETAYVHRDAILDFNMHYEGPANSAQVHEGITYLYKFWNTVQFMDGGETYQNVPDLDVKDYLVRFYGKNLNRLIEQKQKWDPTNFFVASLSLPKVFSK